MKNLIYSTLLVVLTLTACNNKKSDDSSVGEKNPEKTALSHTFYKRLEGTIAGKPVVMHLQNVNDDFSGVYYYNASWLNLSTDTLIGQDSVILYENGFYDYYFDKDSQQAKIGLKWNGNGFTGTWFNEKENKKFPVVLQEKYPEGSYEFTAGIYQDSVKAMANDPKSPVAQISFEYLKPKLTNEAGTWLDNQLLDIQGIKTGVKDRTAGFKEMAKAYFTDYKNQIAEQVNSGPDRGFLQWMNYTDNSQQSIAYNDNGYVVIDFLSDAYTGGAHGNYGSTMYCLDVKNKKRMELGDILNIDTTTLQKVLEKSLRRNYNIKPNEQLSAVLFDNYLKPNNNFYFNANGIAFMYNPYEVASYAQGQIVVFVPFMDIKSYLTPEFTKRMKIE